MTAGQRRAGQAVAGRNTPNACGAKESAVTVGSMALAGKPRRVDALREAARESLLPLPKF